MKSVLLIACLAAAPLANAWTQQVPTKPPQIDCTWLLVDTVSKTATFLLTAGMTGYNGAMNFNGYKDGALTLTVPLNWNVVMRFTNQDTEVPHAAQIVDSVRPLPAGPANPAFPRAQTGRLMQGIPAGQAEEFKFVANKPGTYLIWCPVPGHGIAGMWIRFKVSGTLNRPTLSAPRT